MSLLLGRRQAVAQDGAVLQRYAYEKAACRTVAQRCEIKARMISWLQGVLRPARTRQRTRTRNFQNPFDRLLAFFRIRLDMEVDMRIRLVHRFDSAFERAHMLKIIGRIRMVRECRCRTSEDDASRKQEPLKRER